MKRNHLYIFTVAIGLVLASMPVTASAFSITLNSVEREISAYARAGATSYSGYDHSTHSGVFDSVRETEIDNLSGYAFTHASQNTAVECHGGEYLDAGGNLASWSGSIWNASASAATSFSLSFYIDSAAQYEFTLQDNRQDLGGSYAFLTMQNTDINQWVIYGAEGWSGVMALAGNYQFDLWTEAGHGADIDFTFSVSGYRPDAIPEPASMFLLGIGLVGGSMLRRIGPNACRPGLNARKD